MICLIIEILVPDIAMQCNEEASFQNLVQPTDCLSQLPKRMIGRANILETEFAKGIPWISENAHGQE